MFFQLRKHKFLHLVFSLVFVVQGMVFQMREAKAFAPPVGVLALPAAGGASVALGGVAVAGGALVGLGYLIGSALAYVYVCKALTSCEADEQVRIPLSTSGIQYPVAPSTVPVVAVCAQGPCVGASRNGWYGPDTVWIAGTNLDLAAQQVGCQSGSYSSINNTCLNSSGVRISVFVVSAEQSTVCPQGYNWSPAGCTLTAQRDAWFNNRLDVYRVGNQWYKYTDLSSSDMSANIVSADAANDTLKVTGFDQYGNPVQVTMQAISSGVKTKVQTQAQDSAGNSYVRTLDLQTDTSGQVRSAEQSTAPGSLQPSTGGYTYSPAPVGSASPQPQTQLQLPTDYARQGEAATAANTLKDRLETSAPSDAGTTGATVDSSGDSRKDQIDQVKFSAFDLTWIPSWQQFKPGNPVACRPLALDIAISHGPWAGLTSHSEADICPYLDIVRQVIGWTASIMTIWYVWRTFARPNGGGIAV